MILKIKGYRWDDWWIYGEEKMRVNYGVVDSLPGIREDYDLMVFPTEENIIFGGNDPGKNNPEIPKCLRIVLRFVDGSEIRILTDSIVYLCNDRGETIEKIVI